MGYGLVEIIKRLNEGMKDQFDIVYQLPNEYTMSNHVMRMIRKPSN